MRKIIPFIILAAVACPAGAQPLEQQELDNYQAKFNEAADNALQALGNLTASKKRDCIAAVGAVRLCDCLAHRMPIGLTFPGYAEIVSKTKAELGYHRMDQIARQGIDTARQARDICVAEVSNPAIERRGTFQQIRRPSSEQPPLSARDLD